MASIDEIIHRFNNDKKEKELELRFKNIDNENWLRLLKKISTDNKYYITKVISFISDDNIKYSYYNNDSKVKTEYIKKKKLVQTFLNRNIKVVLSIEKQIDAFKLNNANLLIRMKIRFSFIIDNWSIDFTIIKTIDSNANISKDIINNYFSKINTIQDCETLDTRELSLEIEAEYKSLNDITIESINNISKLLIDYEINVRNLLMNINRHIIKPKPLTKQIYITMYEKGDYYMSSKIDGIEVIVIIDKNIVNIYDRSLNLLNSFSLKDKENEKVVFQGEMLYVKSNNFTLQENSVNTAPQALVKLNAAPAALVKPNAAPAALVKPNAAPAALVKPNAAPAALVKPNAAPAALVKPNAAPAALVKPNAAPAALVKPNAAPAALVKPNAAPAALVKPNAAPAALVKPNAAPAALVKPNAAPAALVKPNAAPAALVKPNASNIYTNLTCAAGNIYTNLTSTADGTADATHVKPHTVSASNTNLTSAIGDIRIYILDIMMINNKILFDTKFIERYKNANIVNSLYNGFKVKSQYHFKEDKINELLKLENQDGIIFTENSMFNEKSSIYKYKQPDKLTIEFTIYDTSTYTKNEEKIYHLLSPIDITTLGFLNIETPDYFKTLPKFSDDTYVLIPFQPFLNPLAYIWHGNAAAVNLIQTAAPVIPGVPAAVHSVGEFLYRGGKWELIKIRPDKDFGNNFIIANVLYNQFFNPITIEFLKNPILEGYFQNEVDNVYLDHRKFVSFVRTQLFKQFEIRNIKNMMVLCAGKGQELFLGQLTEADNIVFIDNDFDALDILIDRIYQINNVKFYPEHKLPKKFPKNYVMKENLQDNYKTLISKIKSHTNLDKFDAIVINLGIHYVLDSKEQLNNFINLINELLNTNGVFLFTCYNGNKLFDLFKNVKEYKYENVTGKLVYNIIPKYTKRDKLDYDCKIDVLLPFTKVYYTENLVDIQSVIKAFIEKKYKIRQYGSIINYLDSYNKTLDSYNIEYTSFYYYVSICKVMP